MVDAGQDCASVVPHISHRESCCCCCRFDRWSNRYRIPNYRRIHLFALQHRKHPFTNQTERPFRLQLFQLRIRPRLRTRSTNRYKVRYQVSRSTASSQSLSCLTGTAHCLPAADTPSLESRYEWLRVTKRRKLFAAYCNTSRFLLGVLKSSSLLRALLAFDPETPCATATRHIIKVTSVRHFYSAIRHPPPLSPA